jgi:transcriptional regulator
VTEEQKAAEQASIVDHVLNVLDVNGLQTALSEIASTLKANAAAIAELREEKNALSEEVKALKETEDARVSAFFTPRQPLNWSVKAGDTASAISEEEMTEAEKATVAEVRQDHNWMKGLTPTGY